jgi:hypothetical protein
MLVICYMTVMCHRHYTWYVHNTDIILDMYIIQTLYLICYVLTQAAMSWQNWLQNGSKSIERRFEKRRIVTPCMKNTFPQVVHASDGLFCFIHEKKYLSSISNAGIFYPTDEASGQSSKFCTRVTRFSLAQ